MKQITIAKKLIKHYEGINNTIPYINNGGCGIFAEYLYHVLLKLGLTPKIIIYTNDIEQLEERINDPKIINGADIIHVMVSIDNQLIDSNGLQNMLRKVSYAYYKKTDKVSIEILSIFNQQRFIWNNTYYRGNNIIIEKFLNKCYKKTLKDLVLSK